jgi:RNA-directed DNA polymerase
MNTPTLIKQLASYATLEAAWNSLNRYNRRSAGLSGETIDDFSQNLKLHLRVISDQIAKGQYRFSQFRGFAIKKKVYGSDGLILEKYRPIKIAEIKDRVVLKAVTNLIGDCLQEVYKLNNEVSFAYRKKFGVENAIKRMVELYRAGNKFVLEADIEKFFDSVNRNKLLTEKIFPVLPDDTINGLIEQGLSQEIGNRDELTELELASFEFTFKGIPQGSTLSPLLSNVCLSEFDQRMIKEGLGLIRYADDFIIMCKSESKALHAHKVALEEIEDKLKLKLHPLGGDDSKTRIVPPASQSFSFLSIRFNGNQIWPDEKKFKELKQKIRYVTDTKEFKDVLTVLRKTNNLICGWLASFSFSDVDRYFDEIDDYVNKELAVALMHLQWKLKTKFTSNTKIKYNGGYPTCLSEAQRKTSGVLTCKEFFRKHMKRRRKIIYENIPVKKQPSNTPPGYPAKMHPENLPFDKTVPY